MGFLSPWFLAGLAAVGLPVWLHLLRQHKSTPKPFSSLMFFEQRTQSSIKHRRLRYLLLLAARLALLVLLALAFANPYITRAVPPLGGGSKLVVLVVDDSFSMRHGDRMAQAKQQALGALAVLGPGDQGQVIALGSQVRQLTQPSSDPGELRAAIQSIEAGDSRSSYGELARSLRALANSARVPLEVHLFSDMEKSSLPAGFADLRLEPNTRLVLHPLADKEEPNWAVEHVAAPRSVYDPKKARLKATIAGFHTPEARRTVSLLVNGKTLESKGLDVPAHGRASVEFTSLDIPYGFSKCEIRIDSADGLSQDDRFLFAVERADPRRVLFVHEPRQSRSVLYFSSALDAASQAAFTLEPIAALQAAGQEPGKYAFVVLSDVASLPGGFEQTLRKYVESGGSVLVAMGPGAASRRRVPVFDQDIVESRYSSRAGERFQSVGWLDPAHPSIRRSGRWEGVKFYWAVGIEPGKARVLARLTDDTPVLLEKQIGEGRVVVFSSTLDNISNDFPLHPSWVPFVEQTALYLSGLEDRPANFLVDAHLELRADKRRTTAVEIIDPAGQRPLSLKEATSALNFQLTREGFYEVRRAEGRHEMVAVNADRRESDLSLIPEETLALWRNTGETPASAGVATEEKEKRWPLWWYAMLIVLTVAVAESLLASRYLGVEKEAA